jgi:hypothetical protein
MNYDTMFIDLYIVGVILSLSRMGEGEHGGDLQYP